MLLMTEQLPLLKINSSHPTPVTDPMRPSSKRYCPQLAGCCSLKASISPHHQT
jgi:hypothetical protein